MICAPSFAMVYLNVISFGLKNLIALRVGLIRFFVPNIVLAYIFVKMLAVPLEAKSGNGCNPKS